MKFCASPIALTLGAVFITAATQNYFASPGFSTGFDSAIGVAELALFGLGLVSLGIVRNRSKHRQSRANKPLSLAWLTGAESRFENPALTEIENR
jgi:hypothetical protein